MSNTSLSLSNLRAFAIVLVVAFHSALAYVVFKPAQLPLATPPYAWKAFPISDPASWFGIDLFCAFPYVTLMQLMFFLSGLFVWQSLRRKGAKTFILDRAWRLGVPFILGVAVLMPVAHYPVYAVSALNPSWPDFWEQWLSVPFWHSGPLWFLWMLLAFDLVAAALFRLVPATGDWLAAHAARAAAAPPSGAIATRGSGAATKKCSRWPLALLASASAPGRYFMVFAAAAALAYLPFAAFFRPWDWVQIGPFAFQRSFLLHYAVFFFAGVGVGAGGLETGLLQSDGVLARRWAMWTLSAAIAFVGWMLMTALTLDDAPLGIGPFPSLGVVVNLMFALLAATACFAFAGVFLRFAGRRSGVADEISKNAYAIYLFHYLFVVWLQYALLSLALPAVAKAAIVFAGALLLSWAAAIASDRTLEHARKVGAALRAS